MKKTHVPAIWIAALAAVSVVPARADDNGGPDLTFSQRGQIEGIINDVSVNDDGEIFIVGAFTSVYKTPAVHFAVLAPDGSLRFTLASHPAIGSLGTTLNAVAADPDGGFFVGGPNGMVHLERRGAGNWDVDTAFSVHNNASGSDIHGIARDVHSLAVTPGRELYAACTASFSGQGFDKGFSLLRMTLSGGVDLSFNPPDGYVSQVRYPKIAGRPGALTTQHLLVAGSFGAGSMSPAGGDLQVVGTDMGCVAERSGSGGVDCGFDIGRFVCGGLVAQNNGNPNYPLPFGMKLIRHDGRAADAGFRAVPSTTDPLADDGAWISAIEVLDAGDLLVAGSFGRIGGYNVRNLAHLTPDGRVDPGFYNFSANAGGITAMVRQKDGKFLLVGTSGSTPIRGTIERRLAMPAAVPVRIAVEPVDTTAYVGDSVCLQARVAGSPAPTLEWYRWTGGSRTLFASAAASALCLDNVTPGMAGDYQLVATGYCGTDASRRAHLTVLPPPPAPANDDFANAIALSGASATGSGTVRSATTESGEPDHADAFAGASAWWAWTATASGPVSIDLGGCDFTAACDVYSGATLETLAKVASNTQRHCHSDGEGGEFCVDGDPLPQFTFTAVAGTVYRFAIGGTPAAGSLGNVALRINPIVFEGQSLTRNPDGSFSFSLSGPDGAVVSIQSTRSLSPADWKEIATKTLSGGQVTFTDPAANASQRSYYRAVLQ